MRLSTDREDGRAPALWRGAALGAGAVILLTALKYYFSSALGQPTPYVLYFGAAVAAAWYGGEIAGLFTGLFAVATGYVLFVRPSDASSLDAAVGALAASVECGAIAFITARLRRVMRARAAADAESRAALEQLRAVLQGVADGVTVQDARGRLIFANENAARMSGFRSASEMLAAPASLFAAKFELLNEERAPLSMDELPGRVLLRGGEARETLVCFRALPDGEERWARVSASVVPDERGSIRFVVNTFEDVTERRRQERALQISREWFGVALRSIGDAVITTDASGAVTFMNPVAEELAGWSKEEASGRPLGDVFPIIDEETRAPVESPVARVLREGKAVGLANHTILRRRDGRESAIDDSAAPIRTAGGELQGVILVFRDVSVERRKEARKAFLMRATNELNSSLDYERTLAAVARLAVPTIADWCAVDMRGDENTRRLAVAHVDPAKVELVREIQRRYPPDPNAKTGVPNVLRTGEPEMLALIPPELIDAAAVDDEHRELIRGLALRSYIAVPIRHGDRTLGVISLVMAESMRSYDEDDLAFAVALGERAAVAIENALLFREAEQLRARAALERDRFAAVIMQAPIAICVLRRDPILRFDLVNEPYRRRVPGAREGGLVSEVQPYPVATGPLDGVFDTGVARVEVEAPTGDGRYVSYSVQPMRDESSAIDRVIVFANDVTDQVLARQRVDAALAQAQAANRSKDEFLAMLGHELRNPLAPIVTALDLMDRRGRTQMEREQRIIRRQVTHVQRLVDDLLDVSRITRGRIELAREWVDIADIVERAREMAGPLIESKRHSVAIDVPRGLIVDGDPTRLAQVVTNLVHNAAKYTADGGHVSIAASREAGSVVLRIRDDGIGIAADMLPRVFDLFVQETQDLDRSRGGLGIGLAIVRGLVTAHGGTVEARSAGPGLGTEVTVYLPEVLGSSAAPEVPSLTAESGPIHRERVLVVDDNADAREMLSLALEMQGHDTFAAPDGESAIELAHRERPTAILLDLGLPRIDGYEVARRLRTTADFRSTLLIALTGYGQASDRARSSDAGFDAHLTKPVDLATLAGVLARLRRDHGHTSGRS